MGIGVLVGVLEGDGEPDEVGVGDVVGVPVAVAVGLVPNQRNASARFAIRAINSDARIVRYSERVNQYAFSVEMLTN